MKTSEIKKFQERLKELGYYLGPIDGIPGEGTKQATENYQVKLRDLGLYGGKIDGLIGPKTLEADEAFKNGVTSKPISPRKEDDTLFETYQKRWDSAEIKKDWKNEVDRIVKKILDNKNRYEAISESTGVPWYVVAVIHNMECSLSFAKHLHNGDPLTARTKLVPAGRPKLGNPPFTWEVSAIDAVRYDGLDKVTDWSIPNLLYTLEKYNGTGYLKYHKDVPSPYLWSGTDQYIKGKYTGDGVWSSTAVSKQIGCVPILKGLGVK